VLNPTDEKFLQAIVRGATPEEAAIAAGLSEKTARVAGARLRKKKCIVDGLAVIGIASPMAPPSAPPATAQLPDEVEAPIDDLPLTTDSKEFLEAVVANRNVKLAQRMEAAKTLLPFQHGKIGEKGKKENVKDAARQSAGEGRFAAAAPPKLVVNNREA
jgi:phage terminase small subunit